MIPGLRPRLRLSSLWPRSAMARPARRSRARFALATGCCAILAAMVGLSAAIETVKPEWRDPEYGHRIVRLQQLERESPGRPLVIVLGTSRAQNAFDPAAMGFAEERGSPLVFNFGQSGSPPLKVLLTCLRILDAGIRPAAVVVEILPFALCSDGPAEGQFEKVGPRFSAADLRRLAPYCADPGVLRARWLSDRIAPWSTQRTVLMSHWMPRWLPWGERIDAQWDGMAPDGFVPFPKQFASPEFRPIATAHAHQEYTGVFAGIPFGEASLRAMRDLAARCRERDIPLAFVQTPVSPMFHDWFRPGVWASGEERLREFARGLDVELVPPGDGFGEADFIDGHHMLSEAAARYSRWLADTHLKPWLIRKGVAR